MRISNPLLFFRRNRQTREDAALRELIPFDPETQYAVIRSSICTGEKVAGFRDRETGRFREVIYLRTPADEQRFREIYNLDTVITEY